MSLDRYFFSTPKQTAWKCPLPNGEQGKEFPFKLSTIQKQGSDFFVVCNYCQMDKAMKNVSKKRWAIMHYGGVTMKGQHMKVKCNMTKMKNDTGSEVKAHLEQVRRMVRE